jgi:DNA repair photolyase
MTTYIEKNYKSILNVHKFIDNWFWTKYGINTYNGCEFGCIYCDSRSKKYYLPKDFHNTIIIKKNVRDMLDKRLARARTLLPDVVGISGANDPYQQEESIVSVVRRNELKKIIHVDECIESYIKKNLHIP